eukprot:3457672-Pleurochrysis_carterae.AAC.1
MGVPQTRRLLEGAIASTQTRTQMMIGPAVHRRKNCGARRRCFLLGSRAHCVLILPTSTQHRTGRAPVLTETAAFLRID